MKMEMIFAGFGGQGALTIGKFIAQACMDEGQHITWFPSYGPEMRGGTANVSVIVDDKPISSPIVSQPDLIVALNQPSLDKFGPIVKSKGITIVNSDLCPNIVKRDDVEYVLAPMNTIATEIGSIKTLNMVAIGIVLAKTGLFKFETIENAIHKSMGEKNPELAEMNIKAIKAGMEIVGK
jgi:2-oxoglutarate ferredoxin oxidoreductase subunit gamma